MVKLMGNVLEALVPESSPLQAGVALPPLDAENFGAKSFTLAAVDTVPTAAWRAENGNISEVVARLPRRDDGPALAGLLLPGACRELAGRCRRTPISRCRRPRSRQAFAKELDRAGLRGSGTAPEPTRHSERDARHPAGGPTAPTAPAPATTAVRQLRPAAVQLILEDECADAHRRDHVAALDGGSAAAWLDTTGQPRQTAVRCSIEACGSSTTQCHPEQPDGRHVHATAARSAPATSRRDGRTRSASGQHGIQRRERGRSRLSGQVGFVCHVRADVAVLYPKASALNTDVKA
ncbi:MAG: hypothetical protein MZW92_24590 [Comamonadaceae bacterium]|nr:hypothetical protein [Comamonadaceae bacterium]